MGFAVANWRGPGVMWCASRRGRGDVWPRFGRLRQLDISEHFEMLKIPIFLLTVAILFFENILTLSLTSCVFLFM